MNRRLGELMKNIFVCVLTVLILATAVCAAEPYGGKGNYMSFALGGYVPSEDLSDEGYKSGGDFSFSYMRTLNNYFGFGGGVHTYSTESSRIASDIGNGDFVSIGIEGLFYIQPNQWRVQPYLALGPAIYFNGLEFERDVDDEEIDESGTGFGFVTKLGVRAFFTKRFFGGVVVKAFSNQWELEIEQGKDKSYKFGGSVMAFELGFTF
jgi:hypothetical protein